MAVDTFIPEVWNASLLVTLRKSYVFGQPAITNRDYEGDIASFGDTVHIGTLARPTVATYTKNVTQINPATLVTTDDTLVIDQSKYFAFEIDDIDARQVRNGGALMTQAAQESAQGLQDTADMFLAAVMVAGAGIELAPKSITTTTLAYQSVLRAEAELDKANVPMSGRFLIVDPEFYAALSGDKRFTDASAYGSTSPIQNGEVGRVRGFTAYKSNNMPLGDIGSPGSDRSHFLIAGHPMATTYAEQINKTEAYRPPDSFSDALKGLHLYGAKVVRPEALLIQDVEVDLDTITMA